ncbi:WD40-repeat-containing domain protein [Jimgerdemannia flammicorona]|uniref:WD40-repeat-containing domain protein n=1 Tax=Jimgerdemannia flammicorona TaxID=994334 RepID=A0A433PXV4_9FUNG|nr:WD40-repeat-containing domain protein [Jimgerdemannia flammicorona]
MAPTIIASLRLHPTGRHRQYYRHAYIYNRKGTEARCRGLSDFELLRARPPSLWVTFHISKPLTSFCLSTSYTQQVNEITWNHSGNLFYITTGQGHIRIFDYPSLELLHTLEAHTANCYCLEVDPRGRYLATGSADAIVSLWDLEEWVCVRTFGKLE